MGGKYFNKQADDNGPPESDNIIPVEPDSTRDNIISSAGNLFARFGLSDISFCLFMAFIVRLRASIHKHEFLDIDCSFKNNHKVCPYLKDKLPPMRLKQLSIITDRTIAEALGLERREFYYLKKKMLVKLRSLQHRLSDKTLHSE